MSWKSGEDRKKASDTCVFKEMDLENYKRVGITFICEKADGAKPANHFHRY